MDNVASYHITISRFEIQYWNLLRELIDFLCFCSDFSRWNWSHLTWRMPKAPPNIFWCPLVSVFKIILKIISNVKLKGILILLYRWTSFPEQTVSLARNKPWIFIYFSIQYVSHLVFFFYVIRNVKFIYRDCSWTKNTICWRKNLKLIFTTVRDLFGRM
jgi:hypothetical protein